jgi:hypothetical protein
MARAAAVNTNRNASVLSLNNYLWTSSSARLRPGSETRRTRNRQMMQPFFSIMIMTRRDRLRRTETFRRSRACFHRFDYAIAWRRVGHKRIEQMLRSVSDIIDGTIKSCLVCLGRLCETAQLPDELKRRSANFIRRRRWTEVVKCFDRSAHVGIINNSRLTINYFVIKL